MMKVSCVRSAIVVLVLPIALGRAQSPDRSGVLFHPADLAMVAGGTLGSFAVTKVDVRIARAFSDTAFHLRHPGFTTAAKRASVVTETVLMISGGTGWAIGRLSKSPDMADVSLHTFESVASAAMFIQVVRGALGRARPYVIDDDGDKRDSDPYEFQALHGFTSFNYRSYPSMHAMASFAAATALVQEMRVRHTPNRQIVGPLLYTGAVMPSLARMYLDEHWTSDIVMGMFLGVLSGQRVVGYSHEHPGNPIDHRFLKPQVRGSISFGQGGVRLSILPF